MHHIADRLDKINEHVGRTLKWVALTMLLLQFFVVLLRYIFGYSFIFLGEGVLYMHAALFMLGAGYTLLHDGHVRVDIFYAKASRATQRKIDILGFIFLMCPALIFLIIYSWPYVSNSWAIREGAISVGGIPASYLLKTLIPAFAILLLIQGTAIFLRNISGDKGDNDASTT